MSRRRTLQRSTDSSKRSRRNSRGSPNSSKTAGGPTRSRSSRRTWPACRSSGSFSGVTGLKPTYGTCSRWGMIAFASSLDQAGVLARSAEDCALLLGAMSGFDPRDSTSAQRAPRDFHAEMLTARDAAGAPLRGLRIGLPREFFPDGLSPDVERAVRAALAEMERLGAKLVEVSLPRTELSIPV